MAPRQVLFLTQGWTLIGDKGDENIQRTLSEITGIDDLRNYKSASVAQKMSWVSLRTTARVEDMAYCMLGIFGVHMPPLYGEGRNAFRRLRIELLQVSDDESIFAWKASSGSIIRSAMRGMLAEWPTEFRGAGDIERRPGNNSTAHHMMTNRGLLFHTPYSSCSVTTADVDISPVSCVPLRCARQRHKEPISIFICKSIVFSRAFPHVHAHRDFWTAGYTSTSSVMEEAFWMGGEFIYVQDASTLDMVDWYCLDVEFIIRGRLLRESLHDIDTSSSYASLQSFGIEDGPYRFRFRLLDTAIVEILFNISMAEGVDNYLILRLFNRRSEFLTSLFYVQDISLAKKLGKYAGSSSPAALRLPLELPEVLSTTVNPNRHWMKSGWSHKVEATSSTLIYRRSWLATSILRCELELQPNNESQT